MRGRISGIAAVLCMLTPGLLAGRAQIGGVQVEQPPLGSTWLAPLVDSSANGFTYGYAPAIVHDGSRYHMFFCSTGTGPEAWDLIRYVTSADGRRWSAPEVVLRPTDSEGERAACDPAVVRYDAGDGPFYYLFYSGNARGVQTVMFVARAAAIGGPYRKFTARGTWEQDAPDPKPIIAPRKAIPDGTPWYGAGQQAVVVKDGRLLSWYTDDSAFYPDQQQREKRVYFTSTTDPTDWPAAVPTNVADPSDASADVKYDPATGRFVLFQTRGEHQRDAWLVRRTSLDGAIWSEAAVVADAMRYPRWAHNVGVAGDEQGWIRRPVLVGLGAPPDLDPAYDNDCAIAPSACWGHWDVVGGFLEEVRISVAGPGTVRSDPAGIACGAECTSAFAPGLAVRLTGEAEAGYVFAGWSGAADCADGELIVSPASTCSARFVEPGMPAAARALNLNGDAVADVLLASENSTRWTMLLGRPGGGGALLISTWGAGWTATPARLNTDALTDLFLYNRETGAWRQAINRGDGRFTLTAGTFSRGWRFVAGAFRPGGVDDLVAYNPDLGGAFLCNVDGAGGFVGYSYKPWSPGWELTVLDLNGDGVADLFVYNALTGEWYSCLKAGVWDFTYVRGQWSPDWTLTAGDFDGNSRDDLFVYNAANGRWYTCLSDGTGRFAYHGGQWSPGWRVLGGRFDTAAADDVFVYNPVDGRWYQCFSDGAGGFRRYVGGQWSTGWIVAATDLDADGLDDVLAYSAASGQYFECLTSSQGHFRSYLLGQAEPGLTPVTPARPSR